MSISELSTGRLGANQELTSGAASTASTAFSAQTYAIRICCTVAVRYVVGDGTPTALATSPYLPPNVIEVVTCSPGQKIAVIQDAAGGKVTVTELV